MSEAHKLREDVEEGLEEDYLMDNIMDGAGEGLDGSSGSFMNEYNDIISNLARLCSIISQNQKNSERKDKIIKIQEQEILDLCPRVLAIV